MQGGEPGEQEGLPLGQLADLRQDGSTSAAAMKARARALRQHHGSAAFKRSSKHKPVEMSSRRPVPVLRDAMQAGKRWAPGRRPGRSAHYRPAGCLDWLPGRRSPPLALSAPESQP